jgi:hypothetical protein
MIVHVHISRDYTRKWAATMPSINIINKYFIFTNFVQTKLKVG